MKVFICANLQKEKSHGVAISVCKMLTECGMLPLIDKRYKDKFDLDDIFFDEEEQLVNLCDIFLTIGGDGTILRWGKTAAISEKPLLGINTGRVGFMATLECNELYKLKKLKTGDYNISDRMMLDVDLLGNVRQRFIALNDVVLSKSRYAKLPEFAISTRGFEVSKIRADGIIFSTPTGSTAYSLSAGGPIVEPESECIEFTPLCPHTLFGRPMIFSGKNEISITYIPYENSEVILSVDGDDDIVFKEGETLLITKSKTKLKLIDIDGGGFYNAVHNKLMSPLK